MMKAKIPEIEKMMESSKSIMNPWKIRWSHRGALLILGSGEDSPIRCCSELDISERVSMANLISTGEPFGGICRVGGCTLADFASLWLAIFFFCKSRPY